MCFPQRKNNLHFGLSCNFLSRQSYTSSVFMVEIFPAPLQTANLSKGLEWYGHCLGLPSVPGTGFSKSSILTMKNVPHVIFQPQSMS